MRMHSFFADTKPQVDQIKRKIVAKFNKPLFITLLRVKTTLIFGAKKRDIFN